MSTIIIEYDGTDITDRVVFSRTSFKASADGNVGSCTIVIDDHPHAFETGYFHAGGTIELFIDGTREWDGWVTTLERSWPFEADDTEDAVSVPRYWTLTGSDRNLLFLKRVMYDKSDPDNENGFKVWPADTSDKTAILYALEHYVDLSGDYISVTGVKHVDTPGPFEEFTLGFLGAPMGSLFEDCAQITGAVYFIGPDRVLRYVDDMDVTAPFSLSDTPTGTEVGYREVSARLDFSQAATEALIWGAGIGSHKPVFQKFRNQNEVDDYGLWQWGEVYVGAWKQATINKRARTYINGSPNHRRGHGKPVPVVSCTIFEPGIRAGQVVDFQLNVFDWGQPLPVRSVAMSFPTPDSVRYDLELSLKIDQPFGVPDLWPFKTPEIGGDIGEPQVPGGDIPGGGGSEDVLIDHFYDAPTEWAGVLFDDFNDREVGYEAYGYGLPDGDIWFLGQTDGGPQWMVFDSQPEAKTIFLSIEDDHRVGIHLPSTQNLPPSLRLRALGSQELLSSDFEVSCELYFPDLSAAGQFGAGVPGGLAFLAGDTDVIAGYDPDTNQPYYFNFGAGLSYSNWSYEGHPEGTYLFVSGPGGTTLEQVTFPMDHTGTFTWACRPSLGYSRVTYKVDGVEYSATIEAVPTDTPPQQDIDISASWGTDSWGSGPGWKPIFDDFSVWTERPVGAGVLVLPGPDVTGSQYAGGNPYDIGGPFTVVDSELVMTSEGSPYSGAWSVRDYLRSTVSPTQGAITDPEPGLYPLTAFSQRAVLRFKIRINPTTDTAWFIFVWGLVEATPEKEFSSKTQMTFTLYSLDGGPTSGTWLDVGNDAYGNGDPGLQEWYGAYLDSPLQENTDYYILFDGGTEDRVRFKIWPVADAEPAWLVDLPLSLWDTANEEDYNQVSVEEGAIAAGDAIYLDAWWSIGSGGYAEGQLIIGNATYEEIEGTGSGNYQTQHPYQPGTLAIYDDGIRLRPGIDYVEVEPANGTFRIIGGYLFDLSPNLSVRYVKAGDAMSSPSGVYRPAPCMMGGWLTPLDGYNATLACSVMALERHTLGAHSQTSGTPLSTPPEHRSQQNDQSGEVGLDDVATAWSNGWGEDFYTTGVVSWGYFVNLINEGRGAILLGHYEGLPFYKRFGTKTGRHALYINDQLTSGNFYGFDPAYGYGMVYTPSELQAFAEGLTDPGMVLAGYTKVVT